jgi:predicted anti-sigma-YlaC factor YlaD
MRCADWRDLLSARLDGEDDPADRNRTDAHLAGCAGCRGWLDRAATITRLTRTAPAAPVPDLTGPILAALPARDRRVPLLYGLLAAVGAVQLVLGLAQVGGGATGAHSHAGAGLTATAGHLWHESAAWNVAVGAGFLLVGVRRSRPTGLVPMLTAFVAMLVLLSVNDLTTGRVDLTRLVGHGFVLTGYLLVLALTRLSTGPGDPAGGRHTGTGWRAHFDEEPPPAPARPRLRLVRPGGPPPATAAYRRAA